MNYLMHQLPLKKIPTRIVYAARDVNVKNRLIQDTSITYYRMVDTKTGKYLGEMGASPMDYDPRINTKIYPGLKNIFKSFYVHFMYVYEKHQKVGSELLKIAHKESKHMGCEGRVNLLASSCYDLKNPPHLFYKKNGFTSVNQELNDYFDKCISDGVQIDKKYRRNLNMYLPLDNKKSL